MCDVASTFRTGPETKTVFVSGRVGNAYATFLKMLMLNYFRHDLELVIREVLNSHMYGFGPLK